MIKRYKKIILFTAVFISLPFIIGLYTHEREERREQLSVPLANPSKNLTPNPHLETLLLEYEQVIAKIMRRTGIPGAAVAIIKDTSVVYLKGFGLKKIDTYDSVDVNTVF